MKHISLIALLAATTLAPHNAYALSSATIAAGNAQAAQDKAITAAGKTVTHETRRHATIITTAGQAVDAGTMNAVAAILGAGRAVDAPNMALQLLGGHAPGGAGNADYEAAKALIDNAGGAGHVTAANLPIADAIINGVGLGVVAVTAANLPVADAIINNLGVWHVTADNVAAAAELLTATLPPANLTALNLAAVVGVAAGNVRNTLVWAIGHGFGAQPAGTIPAGIAQMEANPGRNAHPQYLTKFGAPGNGRAFGGGMRFNVTAAHLPANTAIGSLVIFSALADDVGVGTAVTMTDMSQS